MHSDYLRFKKIEEELEDEEIHYVKEMVKLAGEDETQTDTRKLTDNDEIIKAFCSGTGPFAD